MKFDYYGNPEPTGIFLNFVEFITKINDNQLWDYKGLRVNIDLTIDYNEKNVLVRWLDIDEGFNDKMIIHDLNEFNTNFTAIND